MDNIKGRVLKGYELLKLIGSGGFGAVYQAHQSVVDREVAIKVILPRHANDPHFIRNFESEANLIARLEHPFTVPLYDFWRDHEGAYLVMRYYPSGNLSQLIHQGGALDYETIARMIEQIASALDAAHAANIIHRDVKPANILLDSSGNAYLSDFGLAKDIETDGEGIDLVGSPAYLSPEVIQNQKASPQSDLYSLGFVLFEMLTGKYAFADITIDSSIMNILDFHLNSHVPDVKDLSEGINFVIQRATAKDPQDRYPSAMALAGAFRQAISDLDADIPDVIHVASDYMVNPYKGLRAFDEADEFTFFGRDKLVKRLLQRLDEDRADSNFLALVGPSGSGKSSVVHAGLVPAIRRGELTDPDHWFIVDMIPSSNPFRQLVATLRSISLDPLIGTERELRESSDTLQNLLPTILPTSDDKLLLVIDQFEELFTQTEDNAIRRQFLDLLYSSLQSECFYLVIMLRADFYDRPMMHQDFGELIQERTQVVLPLTSMELNNVITKPAEYTGLNIEAELTAAIVADIQAEAVALPLLQYALTEVFERRDDNQLTLSSYREIGGIAGALAHRADEIYNDLASPLQDIARQIFLRFVTLGEGTEDTRRRAKRSELLSVVNNNDLLQQVLDAFGQARLLTFDNDEETREPTVEVAHEALIREWDQLRDWLDLSRDDIRRQRILGTTAKQWISAKRDKSYLLRGTQLLQVEEWRKFSSIELSENERHFIANSMDERERLEDIETKRLIHKEALEQQSRNRLRAMLAVFGIATFVAGLLSLFAFNQANAAQVAQEQAENSRAEAENSQATTESLRIDAVQSAGEADANRIEAERSAEIALSIAVASGAQREYDDGYSELGLALALDAVNINQDILTEVPDLAYQTLLEIAHAPGVVYEASVMNRPIEHLAISSDGQFAVFGSGQNPLRYWDVPQPTGGRPAAGGQQPSREGQQNPPPPLDENFDLLIWDIDERVSLTPMIAHESPITDVIFMTQANITDVLVSASDDGRIIFWDFEQGTIINEFNISGGFVVLTASANSETLLVAANGNETADGTLTLINPISGDIVAEYPVRDDLALARMTSDARYIVGLHLNGDVITWDAQTGDEMMMLNIPDHFRLSTIDLVINPDNQMIAINTGGDTIPLFNVETGQSLGIVTPSAAGTHRFAFNVDGSQMIATSRDGIITVWDIVGQFFVREFRDTVDMPTGIIWQSENDVAIVSNVAGDLRFYSIEGDPVDLLDTVGSRNALGTVWVSETEVAVIYRAIRSRLAIHNLETGEEQVLTPLEDSVNYDISLSPDRRYLILFTQPTINSAFILNPFRIFDLETGEEINCTFCTATNPSIPIKGIFVNSSPNRILLADGRAVSLWDLETQSEIWNLADFEHPILYLSSSDDGTILALALANQSIIFLDAATGAELGTFQADDSFSLFAISPDNTYVAVTFNEENEGGKIYLYDWRSGEEIREFAGHELEISALQFLSDGTGIISASHDTTVILWDIEAAEIRNRFVHDLLVYDFSLSPDESLILTTPEDNAAHLWNLETPTLEQITTWVDENRLIRNPSEGECSRNSISRLCEEGEGDD